MLVVNATPAALFRLVSRTAETLPTILFHEIDRVRDEGRRITRSYPGFDRPRLAEEAPVLSPGWSSLRDRRFAFGWLFPGSSAQRPTRFPSLWG
jgi:hypothetical protein